MTRTREKEAVLLQFTFRRVIGNAMAVMLVSTTLACLAWSQTAPLSPNTPWHSAQEASVELEAEQISSNRLVLNSPLSYSLAELIDLAQSNNPQTRMAWERARARANAVGVARSELYPTLVAAVL